MKLHADSVVLITSRSTGLLRDSCTHVQEVPLLPQAQAELLFAGYAFAEEDSPPAAVRARAAKVVKLCDGLPLTIKVRVSRLHAVCCGLRDITPEPWNIILPVGRSNKCCQAVEPGAANHDNLPAQAGL